MSKKIVDDVDDVTTDSELMHQTLQRIFSPARAVRYMYNARLVSGTCILLVLIGAVIFGWIVPSRQITYLDIDVNPSIEFAFNSKGKVIGSYAYNEQGCVVLEGADIEGKGYDQLVSWLVDRLAELGYLDNDQPFIATLNTSKQVRRLTQQLSASIVSQTEVFAIDNQTKQQSRSYNLTPAKYLAIQELMSLDPTATVEGCRGHSITEIRNQIHKHTNDGEDNHGHGNGHN